MRKRLWQILGPVVCAALLVVPVLALTPTSIQHKLKTEKSDAVSLSKQVFKSKLKKERALTDNKQNFVPFFGSSEWSRMDAFHPSVLAEAYNRNYTPFLLGQKGAASMTHFFSMNQVSSAMQNKKAIYFVSPQWFTKAGANKGAFQSYFSNGELVAFLKSATSSAYDRYAAKRLLKLYPQVPLKGMVKKIAKGQALSSLDKAQLSFQSSLIAKEDSLFDKFSVSLSYKSKIGNQAASLPKQFSYDSLMQLATAQGKKESSNNRFGIKNDFYSRRVASNLTKLADSQKQFNYLSSSEYSDLQLVLKEFAKNNTNVLFVIPPVNSKWASYTGLSQSMYRKAVAKIKYQLQSQGFTHIADLSEEGDKSYFMQDTIHLGWNGWLAMDKYVNPFLSNKQTTPTYTINDKFLDKTWAKYTDQPEAFTQK